MGKLFAVILGILALGTGPAQSETRALLIGVSEYDHLDADLDGPRNDVGLMLSALVARGLAPGHATVLGEGPTQARPMRAAILAAMQAIAADSAAGDTVIFYFSGRGALMPGADGDERIFLPADARGWRPGIGTVENALRGAELRAWAEHLTGRGVAFVAILDTSHFGAGFRALNAPLARARHVGPAALGVPDDADPPATHDAYVGLTGDFVFLHAAQPGQRSFEYPLGDAADPASWYGDFTGNLARVLRASGPLTYDQWVQAATAGMRRHAGRPAQLPVVTGTLRGAPVPGGDIAPTSRIAIRGGVLQDGALSGLTPGAVLTVYAAATGGAALGRAEVTSVTPTTAAVRGLDGLALPPSAHAELRAPGLPPAMRIAPPRPAIEHDGYEYRPLTEAFDRLAADAQVAGARLGDGSPDAVLVMMDGTLALAGGDGVLDAAGPETSPRFRFDPEGDIDAQLAGWLARIARRHRLDAALSGLPSAGLRITLERGPGAAHGTGCAAPRPPEPLADGGTLHHCDRLWVSLTNQSDVARDVTIFHVDRDFRISALWPGPDLPNRIEPGGAARIDMQIVNRGDPGAPFATAREELIVLAVPVGPDDPPTDLTGLADGTVARAFTQDSALAPLGLHRFGFEVHPRAE